MSLRINDLPVDGETAKEVADVYERVLKALNQGATLSDIRRNFGLSVNIVRKVISTLRVHMTTEEAQYFRELAEYFGMLPNEAIVYCAREGAARLRQTHPPASDSELTDERRHQVFKDVYDRMVGQEGSLPRLDLSLRVGHDK